MKPNEWIKKRVTEIYNDQTMGGISGAFDRAIIDYLDKLESDQRLIYRLTEGKDRPMAGKKKLIIRNGG